MNNRHHSRESKRDSVPIAAESAQIKARPFAAKAEPLQRSIAFDGRVSSA